MERKKMLIKLITLGVLSVYSQSRAQVVSPESTAWRPQPILPFFNDCKTAAADLDVDLDVQPAAADEFVDDPDEEYETHETFTRFDDEAEWQRLVASTERHFGNGKSLVVGAMMSLVVDVDSTEVVDSGVNHISMGGQISQVLHLVRTQLEALSTYQNRIPDSLTQVLEMYDYNQWQSQVMSVFSAIIDFVKYPNNNQYKYSLGQRCMYLNRASVLMTIRLRLRNLYSYIDNLFDRDMNRFVKYLDMLFELLVQMQQARSWCSAYRQLTDRINSQEESAEQTMLSHFRNNDYSALVDMLDMADVRQFYAREVEAIHSLYRDTVRRCFSPARLTAVGNRINSEIRRAMDATNEHNYDSLLVRVKQSIAMDLQSVNPDLQLTGLTSRINNVREYNSRGYTIDVYHSILEDEYQGNLQCRSESLINNSHTAVISIDRNIMGTSKVGTFIDATIVSPYLKALQTPSLLMKAAWQLSEKYSYGIYETSKVRVTNQRTAFTTPEAVMQAEDLQKLYTIRLCAYECLVDSDGFYLHFQRDANTYECRCLVTSVESANIQSAYVFLFGPIDPNQITQLHSYLGLQSTTLSKLLSYNIDSQLETTTGLFPNHIPIFRIPQPVVTAGLCAVLCKDHGSFQYGLDEPTSCLCLPSPTFTASVETVMALPIRMNKMGVMASKQDNPPVYMYQWKSNFSDYTTLVLTLGLNTGFGDASSPVFNKVYNITEATPRSCDYLKENYSWYYQSYSSWPQYVLLGSAEKAWVNITTTRVSSGRSHNELVNQLPDNVFYGSKHYNYDYNVSVAQYVLA